MYCAKRVFSSISLVYFIVCFFFSSPSFFSSVDTFPSLVMLSLSGRLNVQKRLRRSATRSILVAYHPRLTELHPYPYLYLTEPLDRSTSPFLRVTLPHLLFICMRYINCRPSQLISLDSCHSSGKESRENSRHFSFIEEIRKLGEFL